MMQGMEQRKLDQSREEGQRREAMARDQQFMNQQMAFNNQSGYPIPPAGYDQYNNPYWIDPANGQMTYNPPQSGLGIASGIGKAVAWAKWLA